MTLFHMIVTALVLLPIFILIRNALSYTAIANTLRYFDVFPHSFWAIDSISTLCNRLSSLPEPRFAYLTLPADIATLTVAIVK